MKFYFLAILFSAMMIASCSESSPKPDDDDDKPDPVVEDPYAFPGAEGFGQDATGGRGGRVIFVSNLNDSGSGSLRSAIQASGPRIVVFTVSGTIELNSKLNISNDDITIAGQTAPGDGITLRNYPVTVGADNVIIRYLRFRMGDTAAQEGDALGGRFQKNIMIDHCSMSWSTDECVSFYANENTTVQWCIIAESLKISVHDKGAHGYGGIWGGKNASFHHNLLAHHDSRNPRLGEEAGKAFALTDLVDLRNNVIYNWGGNSLYGGEAMNVNIVNCYYKPGPATAKHSSSKQGRIASLDKNKIKGTEVYDTWGKFYINGNMVEGHADVNGDNWTYGVFNQFHGSYTSYSGTCKDSNGNDIPCEYSIPVTSGDKMEMALNTAHNINDNVTTHFASVAYDRVIDYGGASLFRDAVDQRIINDVETGSYEFEGSEGSTDGIIDSQADVGGWPTLNSTTPPLDSDGDGMPDDWETDKELDPEDPEDAIGHDLSTAYDNIEVYINSLVDLITTEQVKP